MKIGDLCMVDSLRDYIENNSDNSQEMINLYDELIDKYDISEDEQYLLKEIMDYFALQINDDFVFKNFNKSIYFIGGDDEDCGEQLFNYMFEKHLRDKDFDKVIYLFMDFEGFLDYCSKDWEILNLDNGRTAVIFKYDL